mmetsp:Transcript_16377/g.31061  ORF Transcript_16377/g.31061 Transcript_16377/m.31061 type:complete len:229 (+) Transcript_16377:1195-1881(+)
MRTSEPLTTQRMPFPLAALNSLHSGSSLADWPRFCSTKATMARASTCSEGRSALPSISSRSCRGVSGRRTSRSVTWGRPSVRVPVLSQTILLTRWHVSKALPPLNRIPARAPIPVATMTTAGVARPRAHGHAMTITAIAKRRAKETSFSPFWMYPSGRTSKTVGVSRNQTANVSSERTTTTGTNMPESRSAYFSIGAFCSWAPSMRRRILPSMPSSPVRATRTSSTPS